MRVGTEKQRTGGAVRLAVFADGLRDREESHDVRLEGESWVRISVSKPRNSRQVKDSIWLHGGNRLI